MEIWSNMSSHCDEAAENFHVAAINEARKTTVLHKIVNNFSIVSTGRGIKK